MLTPFSSWDYTSRIQKMVRLVIPITRAGNSRTLDQAIKMKLETLTPCLPTSQVDILLEIRNNDPITYPDINKTTHNVV